MNGIGWIWTGCKSLRDRAAEHRRERDAWMDRTSTRRRRLGASRPEWTRTTMVRWTRGTTLRRGRSPLAVGGRRGATCSRCGSTSETRPHDQPPSARRARDRAFARSASTRPSSCSSSTSPAAQAGRAAHERHQKPAAMPPTRPRRRVDDGRSREKALAAKMVSAAQAMSEALQV